MDSSYPNLLSNVWWCFLVLLFRHVSIDIAQHFYLEMSSVRKFHDRPSITLELVMWFSSIITEKKIILSHFEGDLQHVLYLILKA